MVVGEKRGVAAAQLSAWSKVPADDQNMSLVVGAVNAYVGGLPVVAGVPEDTAWPASVTLGALMLGARLLRRRNSPNGVEALTSDVISYTARYDSDIARMLGLDGFESPAVG
ncbi:hypothetical protein O159_25240 [Leifsonia xyli subsp. cynodontis DSM 46306]|uniref:Uncharacterized protein n=1 Tax=Leifsonia xyli subsp. cynodontis DSM 46306 TaxID=1389489 RepID=U3PCI1_LEIXC|nr:hypothetical protein [Leifsonia xyli]AGW42457.1 hypothetical protein O159_25240 [Leifsonia xyli subsp. cynodontis DSM 46306]